MRLKTILILFVLIFSLATAVEAGWKPSELPLDNRTINMNSPANTIVFPFIKYAIEPLTSGLRPLYILSHNATTNDNFTLAKGDPHSTCPPTVPYCHLVLTDIEPNWIGREEVTVGAGPTGAIEITTFFVTVNDTAGLSISNFQCDDTSYFEGENVQCSAKITWAATGQAVVNATLEIHDDDVTPTLLGSCTTYGNGECTANFRAQPPAVQHTVYANAYPADTPLVYTDDYLPYTAKTNTYQYTTESAYQVQNLKTYNDALDQEDTFYRDERYYVSFNVYDVAGDDNVTPSSTPTGYIVQVKLVNGASEELLDYDHADGATFYYTQQVPLSDDFLDSSDVVVFFEDTTPEHKSTTGSTTITVQNNLPEIYLSDLTVPVGQIVNIPLAGYGYDTEDTTTLTWSVEATEYSTTNPSFTAQIVNGDELQIEGLEIDYDANLTLRAEDSEGDYVEATVYINVGDYEIQELTIYNDSDFSQVDNEFYRTEHMYVSFKVHNHATDDDVDPSAVDILSEVWLEDWHPGPGYAELQLTPTTGPNPGYFYFSVQLPTSDYILSTDTNDVVLAATFENLTSASYTESWLYPTVLNNPPEIKDALGAPIQTQPVTVGQSIVVDLSQYESDIEDTSQQLVWGLNGAQTTNLDAEIIDKTLTITSIGTTAPDTGYVYVRLRDHNEGSAVQTIEVSIVQANSLPYFSPPLENDQHSLDQGTYITQVYTMVDDDLDTVTPSIVNELDGQDLLITGNQVRFQWSNAGMTTAGPGAHTITLELDDTKDTVQYSFVLTIYDNNQAPMFTSTPDTETYFGETYAYDADALDPNDDPLNYGLLLSPIGMQINEQTGEITWTPLANDVGQHNVIVEVTDGTYSATQQYTLTVYPAQHTPLITTTALPSATENVPYSFTVEAIDPDFGDTLTYSLLQAPGNMQINEQTGLITWTNPIPSTLPYTVRVQVSDSTTPTPNTDVKEYQLTVYYDVDVSFTINADKLSGEGPLTVEFQITDFEGNPPLSCDWDFGDGSAVETVIVENTGVMPPVIPPMTHTFTEPGTYTVTVTITDTNQDTATETITIRVDEEHKELSREKVKVDSLNIFNADTLFPGDYATLRIKFTNNDNYDMEKVKITARIDELDSRASVGPFDVDSGDTVNRNLILDIPYDAEDGEYLVRVIMTQGGRVVRVLHRFVTVQG